MEAQLLPPYSCDERQYNDLHHSPDDFNPDIPIQREVFIEYFAMEAVALIASYKKDQRRVKPSLYHEARHPDLMVSGFSTLVRHKFGRDVLTWGDFQWILKEWTNDWDEKHGYMRSITSDSPCLSEPIA